MRKYGCQKYKIKTCIVKGEFILCGSILTRGIVLFVINIRYLEVKTPDIC